MIYASLKLENTMRSKLKIYKIGFCPIVDGYIRPPREVLIVALSEEQAKKYMRDWMVNKKRCNYFFEGIEKVNKTSKEGKHMLSPYTIEERLHRQLETIYGKEDKA